MSAPVKAEEPKEQRLTKGGRKTRERIIETAAELMFHRGAGGTSIPDIQAAAGVSASQIYHYFGDKQGLVLAVIDHQTDTQLAQQRPLLDNLDSIEALREWCDRAGNRQDARGCEGGCEIGSLAERRIAMLIDPALSGLPPFLTPMMVVPCHWIRPWLAPLLSMPRDICRPAPGSS